MPLKLIGTMILLVAVTIFCGFNLDNKCDVSVIFYTFKSVPAFLTVLISFFAGIIVMTPFTIGKSRKNMEKKEEKAKSKPADKKSVSSKTDTLDPNGVTIVSDKIDTSRF